MAENDFVFGDDAISMARNFRRTQGRRALERSFQGLGAGAATLAGGNMADELAKRPLSGEWMLKKEKLDRTGAILPQYAGKETQQQQLGYTAINDDLNRALDMSKAAMELQRNLAQINLEGSIASLRVQNEREERALRASLDTLQRASAPSDAAMMASQQTGSILDRYTQGAYSAAVDRAYAQKLANIKAQGDTYTDPDTGETFAVDEIPASVQAQLRQEASQDAAKEMKAMIYALPDAQRSQVIKDISDTFTGGAYTALTEYDRAHLAKLTAEQLGIGTDEFVRELERFNPEAAQNVVTTQMLVTNNVNNATSMVESDNYRRTHSGTGQAAAGASTKLAQQAQQAMYTRMDADPSNFGSLPPYIQSAAKEGRSRDQQAPAAEAPVVDIGARVGQALADEAQGAMRPRIAPQGTGPSPSSAIEATQQAIAMEAQAQAQQDAAQQDDPAVLLGLSQSRLQERMPNFQLPSDALGKYRAMLDTIEAFPEHGPVIEAKAQIMESPLFKDYMRKRGYEGDPDFAFKEFQREAKLAQRTRRGEVRQAYERNVQRGLVQPAAFGRFPGMPSREDKTAEALAEVDRGVPTQRAPKTTAELEREATIRNAQSQLQSDLAAQQGRR